MTDFTSIDAIRQACLAAPPGDHVAAEAAQQRQANLTKPAGSLGRLEQIAAWLATWQGRAMPKLDRIEVLIFAGNHGVTAQNVSPFPAAVTAQMVGNFANGGACINQLAAIAGARLRVVPLALDTPTEDITEAPAMNEASFLDAVKIGYAAVTPCDLLCLGEMGIGNTTVAAALAARLFGGAGHDWAGRGTGIDDAGLLRKIDAIDQALARHPSPDPLAAASALGGRELAAILGATLAARHQNIPVLLDGFVCTVAAAPLEALTPGGLDHAMVAHRSAEAAHGRLIEALGKQPLLDLGMRLGEGSGAAVAALVLKAAVACHTGMATFAEASVSGRDAAS